MSPRLLPKFTQLLNGEATIQAAVLMPMSMVLPTLPHPLQQESGDLVKQGADFDSSHGFDPTRLKRQRDHIYFNPEL